MQVSSAAHQILYLSQLAFGYEYDTFTAMCRAARCRNARTAATGVLLFDGHRFCQLLQGAPDVVRATMAELARQPHHDQMVVLLDASADPARLQPRWVAGYCDPHELDVFEAPERVRGEAAIAAFRDVMSRAELSS